MQTTIDYIHSGCSFFGVIGLSADALKDFSGDLMGTIRGTIYCESFHPGTYLLSLETDGSSKRDARDVAGMHPVADCGLLDD